MKTLKQINKAINSSYIPLFTLVVYNSLSKRIDEALVCIGVIISIAIIEEINNKVVRKKSQKLLKEQVDNFIANPSKEIKKRFKK